MSLGLLEITAERYMARLCWICLEVKSSGQSLVLQKYLQTAETATVWRKANFKYYCPEEGGSQIPFPFLMREGGVHQTA